MSFGKTFQYKKDDERQDEAIGDRKFREYLPFATVEKYLKSGIINREKWLTTDPTEIKPWLVETRSHNAIQEETRQVKDADGYFVEKAIRLKEGWSIAIALNQIIESPAVIQLGGEGHRAILQRVETLDNQWKELKIYLRQTSAKVANQLRISLLPECLNVATAKITVCLYAVHRHAMEISPRG